MRRKSFGFLASVLCAGMILSSNGMYAFSDSVVSKEDTINVETIETELGDLETKESGDDDSKAEDKSTEEKTDDNSATPTPSPTGVEDKDNIEEDESKEKATETPKKGELDKDEFEEIIETPSEDALDEKDVSDENEESKENKEEKSEDSESKKDESSVKSSKKTEEFENEIEKNEEEELEIEAEPRLFVDVLGYSFKYSPAVTYNYTINSGVLEAIKDSSGNDVTGNIVIPDDQGITSISNTAFRGNVNITYVSIPNGVTSIAANAFEGCSSLKSVSIPKTVTAISDEVFKDCASFVQIAIPKSVTSIGNGAFQNDAKLYMVYVDDIDYSQLTTIGDSAFRGCVAIEKFCSDSRFIFPTKLNTIGDNAFEGCNRITYLPIGAGVATVGSGAFKDCTAIDTIDIPAGLDTISDYAFSGCSSLTTINVDSSSALSVVGNYAFKDCYSLGTINLGHDITNIGEGAFKGCSNLRSIYVRNKTVTLGTLPFESPKDRMLYLYSYGKGSIEEYCKGKTNIMFVNLDESTDGIKYKYDTQIVGSGKVVLNHTVVVKDNSVEKDVNADGGVAIDTNVTAIITPDPGYIYKEGSFKVNGVPTTVKNGKASFKMPQGGALLSVEFVLSKEDLQISGTSFSVGFSNGKVDEIGDKMVSLKIGENSRIILTDDGNGTVIPDKKITYKYQGNTDSAYATVDASGAIKAIKKGTCKVVAKVIGRDNQPIEEIIVIEVTESKVENLLLKATDYDSMMVDLGTTSVAPIYNKVSISKVDLKKGTSFKLRATAYDGEEKNIATPLTWTSSDSNIAKLSYASTPSGQMYNTVTVPVTANGEATIIATATIDANTKVVQKFVVQVVDYSPRVAVSTITVNPNKTAYSTLKLIESYGATLNNATSLKFKDDSDFKLEYYAAKSGSGVHVYNIVPRNNLSNGTYSEKLQVSVTKGGNQYNYELSITIKVAASFPAPTVSFKKGEAFDLLYKNAGTVITPELKNLAATDSVVKFELEDLASDPDKRFTENFQVDPVTGVITQKTPELTCKEKKTFTGYYVMSFTGYKGDLKLKRQITVPTKTTAPKYTMSATSGVFYSKAENQTVYITLTDTATKTAVDLSSTTNGTYSIGVESGSCIDASHVSIAPDGRIKIELFDTDHPMVGNFAGTIKMSLTNDEWVTGKKITGLNYVVNAKTVSPTISLSRTSVKVNPLAADVIEEFGLKSNQLDTVILSNQTFTALSNAKNQAEYDKLQVTYTGGVGQVEILDSSVKAGTYKFVCTTKREGLGGAATSANNVTLSVVVANTKPTFKLTGTVSLNVEAMAKDYTYSETAKLKITQANIPTGYVLDDTATISTLTCLTKGYTGTPDWIDLAFLSDSTNDYLGVSLATAKEPPKVGMTYSMQITPTYSSGSGTITAAPIKFNVKVYSGTIGITLSQAGKLNLVDRVDPAEAIAEYSATPSNMLFNTSNSIIFTPKMVNLVDTVADVKVFDANDGQPDYNGSESDYFTATLLGGKIYVTPKIEADGSYAPISTAESYKIMLWITLDSYQFGSTSVSGKWSNVITIKPAQVLPTVTNDAGTADLYLSKKNNVAKFSITPKKGSKGYIEEVFFGEKDEKNLDTFDISYAPQSDGSIEVTISLKDTVAYSTGSVNKIPVYVKYKGQGTNTNGILNNVNIRINR